jgi:hypothetical protein
VIIAQSLEADGGEAAESAKHHDAEGKEAEEEKT